MDLIVTADHHPALGETVPGLSLEFFPGGKGANQAVAAAKSGASTALIGKVGKDVFAPKLLRFLAESGVELSVFESEVGTVSAMPAITQLATTAHLIRLTFVIGCASCLIGREGNQHSLIAGRVKRCDQTICPVHDA